MLKKIFYSFLSKGTIAGINFLILIFSARYLGVRTRGEISIFLLNVALVQLVAEVYTGYSLVHFFSHFNHRKIIGYGIVLLFSVVIVSAFLVPSFAILPKLSMVQYALILFLVMLHSFFCVVVLGMQKLKLYNLLALLQPCALLILLAFQLYYFKSFTFDAYYTSVCSSFCAALIVSSLLVFNLYHKKTNHRMFNLKAVIGKGFYFQATVLMLMFINRYNYYWLGGTARVGLYATASALMESLLLVASAATPVFLAKLSTNQMQGENVLKIIRLCLIIVIAAYGLFWFMPEQAVLWLIGPGFSGIRMVMLSYGPSVIFQSGCILLGSYFTANGHQKKLMRAYAIPFLLTILCSPICVYYFDLIGAAILAGIIFLMVFVQLYLEFCKLEKLNPTSAFRFFALKNEIKFLIKDL